jgi:DNA-binding HxlR family transcriptional regulator
MMMMMPTTTKATKTLKADKNAVVSPVIADEVAANLIDAYQAEPAEVAEEDEALGGAPHGMLEKALQVVGDKYSLQILNLLLRNEAQRFVQLEATIQGISPRTLSARLKHLEAHGLLSRKAYATIPPKVEYRITERGMAITPIVVGLTQWVTLLDPTVKSKKS